MLNGILNIYKEKGYTSHDVVAKARRILGQKRIGHTGTLDPEAQGVLPLCLGYATKAVQYITDLNKCYEAEVILGAYTTTEDSTGQIIETFNVDVTQTDIEQTVASFKGSYVQIPPMYSAIKVNGVRLYELARQGITIERPERKVSIYDCEIIEWLSKERFKIRVACSKGTYIRTLCTDIGKKLGCGAYMGELLRTQVGKYQITESITLDILENTKQKIEEYIYPLEEVFINLRKVKVKHSANSLLLNGNKLYKTHLEECIDHMPNEKVRVYDYKDQFIAVYNIDQDTQCLSVEKMFNKL